MTERHCQKKNKGRKKSKLNPQKIKDEIQGNFLRTEQVMNEGST